MLGCENMACLDSKTLCLKKQVLKYFNVKCFFLSEKFKDIFLTTIEPLMLPKYRLGINTSLIKMECIEVVLTFEQRYVKGLLSYFLMIYFGSLTFC